MGEEACDVQGILAMAKRGNGDIMRKEREKERGKENADKNTISRKDQWNVHHQHELYLYPFEEPFSCATL